MRSMNVVIVREPLTDEVLMPLMEAWHKTMVKGVADIDRKIIALGGEWHMDANTALIADGSDQKDLWGFNLYPEERGDTAIEYISLINIRPAQGNRDMEIEDEITRAALRGIVAGLIPSLGL